MPLKIIKRLTFVAQTYKICLHKNIDTILFLCKKKAFLKVLYKCDCKKPKTIVRFYPWPAMQYICIDNGVKIN